MIRINAMIFMELFLIAPMGFAQSDESLAAKEGDIELRLSGDVARLFDSEVTGFNLNVGAGYFLTDWLEVGLGGSVSFLTDTNLENKAVDINRLTHPSGNHILEVSKNALTTGTAVATQGGWAGGATLLARCFPLASLNLPAFLAPFLSLEFGSLFVEGLNPFIVTTGSAGVHFYLSKHVAITPEIGYGFVLALDEKIHFDGSHYENIFGFDWGISVFF